ncbi:hypothetical protein ROJ8625_02375 [Roseivivax jejudonensis]|uniref:Tetratricopeptide repeat protein n=1 Tax=Roseivivax jejudonensis TaxID=1529041 RepID=A0A1X6ZEI9_9RHOB|nr:hypothetical protein [Roseivivax jejudonensis]SLN48651.1 hypothetical protein ROJ8625_02375 [Roseivivax jejudonensis]
MHDRLIAALDALEQGDWTAAHDIAQDDPSPEGAWMHAHLHRIEGDEGNAAYWYSRAGREKFPGTVEEEAAALRETASRAPSGPGG